MATFQHSLNHKSRSIDNKIPCLEQCFIEDISLFDSFKSDIPQSKNCNSPFFLDLRNSYHCLLIPLLHIVSENVLLDDMSRLPKLEISPVDSLHFPYPSDETPEDFQLHERPEFLFNFLHS